jgi:hypothetical protein
MILSKKHKTCAKKQYYTTRVGKLNIALLHEKILLLPNDNPALFQRCPGAIYPALVPKSFCGDKSEYRNLFFYGEAGC